MLSLLYRGSRDGRVGSILINFIVTASFSTLNKVNDNNNNNNNNNDNNNNNNNNDNKLPCWTIFLESKGE